MLCSRSRGDKTNPSIRQYHGVHWKPPTHEETGFLVSDGLSISFSVLSCFILIGIPGSYDLSQLRECFCRCRLFKFLNVTRTKETEEPLYMPWEPGLSGYDRTLPDWGDQPMPEVRSVAKRQRYFCGKLLAVKRLTKKNHITREGDQKQQGYGSWGKVTLGCVDASKRSWSWRPR